MGGILIQDALSGSSAMRHEAQLTWFWLAVLAVSAAAALLLFIAERNRRPRSYKLVLLSFCVFVCFLCLGAVRLVSFRQPYANDVRNTVRHERKLATIRGLILTEPFINRNQDWEFAEFTYADPTSSFYLGIKQIKTMNGWAKTRGTVRVQVAEPVLDLSPGDYIQAYCWLDRFRDATNPGQFDFAEYLARRNIFVAAHIKTRDGITILKDHAGRGRFRKLQNMLREKVTQALVGDVSPDSPDEGLLRALLLGYRGDIDSKTYEAFRRTGLLHLISLSGLHLGILIGIIWWLCKTAGLMKPTRAVICSVGILLFLLIVPPRAPTVRAAIIGWVFCASFIFRRHSNPVNTLSLAAIILLLIRPTQLFEAGWQLSFASVLGLVLFCERIHLFLYETITRVPWRKRAPKTRPFFHIISRPGPYLLRLLSTGLTAWLSGAGILLYHFYMIHPLTSIWTIIVFPLVAVILTIGYAKIIVSFLLPTIGSALGILVTNLAQTLIWLVEHIPESGVCQILIGHVSPVPIVLYYGIVFFAAFAQLRRPLLKKVMCIAMVLPLAVFLVGTKWERTHRRSLILSCLDVGHGQAILLQLPGRANVLFDAGSLHRSDIGRRIVVPFLDYIGTRRIDAIIISHSDVDHINGIPEVIEQCAVGSVFASHVFLDQTDQANVAFLTGQIRESGMEIQRIHDYIHVCSPARIRMLWPTNQAAQDGELSDNDKSLVCLIEFANTRVLLCSDIEVYAQEQLLALCPDLQADVVLVPHHGLARTLSDDFLKALNAQILICSCGRSEHEKGRTIKPCLSTAEHGAVIVCIGESGTIRHHVTINENERDTGP